MGKLKLLAKYIQARLVINTILLIVRRVIGLLNLFIPRDSSIWVVGSWYGKRYSDNSRFFYEGLINGEYNNEVYWVTRDKKIYNSLKSNESKVIMFWSIKSLYIHLKAGLVAYDMSYKDVNYLFTSGAMHLNLWHGIPIKKIGKKSKIKKNVLEKIYSMVDVDEYFLATSTFTKEIFKKAFEIDDDKCIVATYPRKLYLEGMIDSDEMNDQYLNTVKLKKQKIVFYLPTFRDNVKTKIFGEDDINKINTNLKEISDSGYTVVTKMHFAETLYHNTSLNIDYIINLPSDYDIYPILKYTDILITDYSSVYFDFLNLNREIIFFPYDLDYYNKYDRGLMFNYEDLTPGEKVTNISDILPLLDKISNNSIDHSSKRKELDDKVFIKGDFNTLVENIFKVLKY